MGNIESILVFTVDKICLFILHQSLASNFKVLLPRYTLRNFCQDIVEYGLWHNKTLNIRKINFDYVFLYLISYVGMYCVGGAKAASYYVPLKIYKKCSDVI